MAINTDGVLRDPIPASIAGIGFTSTTLGFYGVTPVVRPTAYTQTYATASRTHSNLTAATVIASAVLVLPFGYSSSAQADNIVISVNNLVTDLTNVKNVLNQLIDDLQSVGIVQ